MDKLLHLIRAGRYRTRPTKAHLKSLAAKRAAQEATQPSRQWPSGRLIDLTSVAAWADARPLRDSDANWSEVRPGLHALVLHHPADEAKDQVLAVAYQGVGEPLWQATCLCEEDMDEAFQATVGGEADPGRCMLWAEAYAIWALHPARPRVPRELRFPWLNSVDDEWWRPALRDWLDQKARERAKAESARQNIGRFSSMINLSGQ